ncbi:MAG: methyltransferase domain-containing protein [Kiritimatiellae bacterium]|nr:methyltransferase domain-containing protein [Kiritimatiellia bacterium]
MVTENERSDGVLGVEYVEGREKGVALRYRLCRRTKEVIGAIKEYGLKPVSAILDLGTAEGRMLHMLHKEFDGVRCMGVERSPVLIELGRHMFPCIDFLQGNVQELCFVDDSFDVVVACAVIEHIADPSLMMKEARRVLKKDGGLFVLTAPDPFWEHMASAVGHLASGQHLDVMNLKQLAELAEDAGFKVLKKQKFMLSPVGLPFEIEIENVVRALSLDFLMANQLLVCRSDDARATLLET